MAPENHISGAVCLLGLGHRFPGEDADCVGVGDEGAVAGKDSGQQSLLDPDAQGVLADMEALLEQAGVDLGDGADFAMRLSGKHNVFPPVI